MICLCVVPYIHRIETCNIVVGTQRDKRRRKGCEAVQQRKSRRFHTRVEVETSMICCENDAKKYSINNNQVTKLWRQWDARKALMSVNHNWCSLSWKIQQEGCHCEKSFWCNQFKKLFSNHLRGISGGHLTSDLYLTRQIVLIFSCNFLIHPQSWFFFLTQSHQRAAN